MPATLTKTPHGPPRKARYQKLRPGLRGANGLSRDQVERHQRTRLYEAMVEIAASGSYQTTTIKAVCALAGVSRQTFYDLFGADKEECFLGAYDYVVDRAMKRIALAYRREQDPERRLCRAFAQFGREVANEPEAARVALVEALGGGPTAVARMRRTRLISEQLIGASFSEAPDGVALPPLILRGIVCGVERITRRRLLAGDVKELPALADELLAWALSYRSPAAATPAVAAPTRDDRGSELWRARARVENDRARILGCAAQIAATRGYAQLTPAQIVGAAEVTEARFDELFQSTEQCFLDALDRLGLEALVCAARASQSSEDRLVGVHRGIVALMRHIATHPVLVRVAFVEIFAVGAAGIQRRERLLGQFADQLVRSLPRSRAPSGLMAEASVGAIWGIVHDHVTRGAMQLLPGLAGHATYLALAPTIGAEAAVQAILAGQSR
ncbi:MAG TPA: TetR/AcrR family transcriptional regulator [Solirubrobacteraceae bacterium]